MLLRKALAREQCACAEHPDILVNFVTAVAYHFCLNLPRAFWQPGARGLADPCSVPTSLHVQALNFQMNLLIKSADFH